MAPDPSYLLKKTGIDLPLIGLFDTPEPDLHHPLVRPGIKGHGCVFSFFKSWLQGKTLHLNRKVFGCGGVSHHLFGRPGRSHQEFIRFLVEDEGLKATPLLMDKWVKDTGSYQPEFEHILIGPLSGHSHRYLKTVTFLVNPDQLSMLMIGAQYFSDPEDPVPVTAPFGSGCMQLVPLFGDLKIPQAIIGATDLAMRRYLPPDILGFTVTVPMYHNLCRLGPDSFLEKGFIKDLKKARQ